MLLKFFYLLIIISTNFKDRRIKNFEIDLFLMRDFNTKKSINFILSSNLTSKRKNERIYGM